MIYALLVLLYYTYIGIHVKISMIIFFYFRIHAYNIFRVNVELIRLIT